MIEVVLITKVGDACPVIAAAVTVADRSNITTSTEGFG